ncbi:putative tetratricopeptide-like helical domain superfamily [Helianthus anomalus]
MSSTFFSSPPSILQFTEKATTISTLRQSHAHMLKTGLIHDPFSASKLISSAASSPHTLSYAHSIFTHLQNPNSYSYNSLIRAYANTHTPETSLTLFFHMLFDDDVEPDKYTFTFVLKACSVARSVSVGEQVHGYVIKVGVEDDVFVCNTLIHMYAKSGCFEVARKVLDEMPERDVISWNAVLSAYVDVGMMEFARTMLITTKRRKAIWAIYACSVARSVSVGEQVHGYVIKIGVEDDVFVCNTLIHMYAKSGCFEVARKVLDEMPERDVISWNAVLSAYVDAGMMEFARRVFDEMPERNVESGNFMISGYVNDGLVGEARRVFDGMDVKDVVSWNGIITGYARDGQFDEVFRLFEDMQKVGMVHDDYTLVNVLSCCARVGGLSQGEWIYSYINRNKISVGGFLATALVDMYAKCGCIEKALEIFSKTSNKDISTWNSMITGFALHGYGERAVETFYELVTDGFKPNEVTFVSVLSACSRSGLLDEGYKMFELMVHTYDIKPTILHYGCMVDLLGRFGLLDEAEKLAKQVPFEESQVVWESLLGACRNHNDVNMAERVTKKLLELDPRDSAGYVQLSNVHASKGRFDDAVELRRKMRAQGVYKDPGCSMIEVDGVVHEFLAGEGMIL